MDETDNRPSVPAERHTVVAGASSASAITQAALVLHQGGLVVFPTDTLYALGADASNPSAIERVFVVKGRRLSSPDPAIGCRSRHGDPTGRHAA